MPRPKKDQTELAAMPRIEKAFWKLLEEKPYSKMTVTDIIQEAGIHRNAFYYHFTSLEDMAQYLVKNAIVENLPAIIVSRLNGQEDFSEILNNPTYQQQYERICLVASDNSSIELIKILRDSVRHNWYKALGFDEKTVDDEVKIAVEFVMGGTMSMLAYRDELAPSELPPLALNSGLMKAITEYMASIRSDH